MNKYITDVIGNEYETWGQGDIVFITSPTGSGKSTFIFEIYLKWCIENKFKILYLVNRKILKLQLEELKNSLYSKYNKLFLGINLSNYIDIKTYQWLENEIIYKRVDLAKMRAYSAVICDEAHYFMTDSTYNTNTFLSLDFIQKVFSDKIQIFLSATSFEIKEYITRDQVFDTYKYYANKNVKYRCKLKGKKEFIKEYSIAADYSWLDIEMLEDEDEISDLICSSDKKKWLIFVSSIQKGKELYDALIEEKGINTEDVAYLDADYLFDEDATKIVDEIVNVKCVSKRILITTSVIDNGVTFKDSELNNILIMADNETEFIQMLGRKRIYNDLSQKVQLYVLKRNKGYFTTKRNYYLRIREVVGRYKEKFDEIQAGNTWNQQNIMISLLKSEQLYDKIRKFVFVYNGYMCINELTVMHIDNLIAYYEDVSKCMDEDEYYFFKQQLMWLERKDAALLLQKTKESKEEQHRKQIINLVEDIIVKYPDGFDAEVNKELFGKVREDIKYLVKKKPALYNNVNKKDRPISVDTFNDLMSLFGLNYTMSKSTQKIYVIKRE